MALPLPKTFDEWSHVEKAVSDHFGRDMSLFMTMLRSSQPKPHLLVVEYRQKTFLSWSMDYSDYITGTPSFQLLRRRLRHTRPGLGSMTS